MLDKLSNKMYIYSMRININHIKTIPEAKKLCLAHSKKNPKLYVLLTSCFGAYIVSYKFYYVDMPNDTMLDGYYLNGKFKEFTEKQIIKNQYSRLR